MMKHKTVRVNEDDIDGAIETALSQLSQETGHVMLLQQVLITPYQNKLFVTVFAMCGSYLRREYVDEDEGRICR